MPDTHPLDHPALQHVLGQVALGHAPVLDRQRQVTALRLTVFPIRPDHPPAATELLALLDAAWPTELGRLALNITSEALLVDLLARPLAPHLMLELPWFMAVDPAHAAALQALHRRGATLMVKGKPTSPLPREVLPCFAYSIIDVCDERRDGLPAPGGVSRQVPHMQSGVTTQAQAAEAFGRGAAAVIGWPWDDIAVPAGGNPKLAKSSVATVAELMRRVDAQESPDRLEAVVRHDPTLAWRLLKYINSPLFGLRVEITSFAHAIMMLGHHRLKRWLALLLLSAGAEPPHRPLAFAAVRRGLFMEALGRDCGADAEQCGELFVCGVFSLLDRMLQQPFPALLAGVPTSPAVAEALQHDQGPFAPYLNLARAIEASSLFDIRDGADAMLLAMPTVNRALLKALADARQLE